MARPQALTRGASHVALVCSDMYETVRFWEALGIPLLKLEELPGGGQHSFHDMGNGAMLSYMTFEAPRRPPPESPRSRWTSARTAPRQPSHR